jgi:hypothetical protein
VIAVATMMRSAGLQWKSGRRELAKQISAVRGARETGASRLVENQVSSLGFSLSLPFMANIETSHWDMAEMIAVPEKSRNFSAFGRLPLTKPRRGCRTPPQSDFQSSASQCSSVLMRSPRISVEALDRPNNFPGALAETGMSSAAGLLAPTSRKTWRSSSQRAEAQLPFWAKDGCSRWGREPRHPRGGR